MSGLWSKIRQRRKNVNPSCLPPPHFLQSLTLSLPLSSLTPSPPYLLFNFSTPLLFNPSLPLFLPSSSIHHSSSISSSPCSPIVHSFPFSTPFSHSSTSSSIFHSTTSSFSSISNSLSASSIYQYFSPFSTLQSLTPSPFFSTSSSSSSSISHSLSSSPPLQSFTLSFPSLLFSLSLPLLLLPPCGRSRELHHAPVAVSHTEVPVLSYLPAYVKSYKSICLVDACFTFQ